MAERIPRAGDRLADVPPGWVVRVPGAVVLVGLKVGFLSQTYVALVRSGCHRLRDNDTVVHGIIGRFVGDEWEPYAPPVKDLPPGTQVHLTGGGCWVVVDDRSGRRFARDLRTDAIRNLCMDEVLSYRNDDTNWEWA